MKIGELINKADIEDIPDIIHMLRKEIPKVIEQAARENAFFKAKVGESGRITIPSAEREALGIQEGDLVQILVRPLKLSDQQ